MITIPPARNIPKVFCSHRWKDKPRVREIARQLREAGIDAWLDEWEIKPGDDFVAAINSALASYDVGLIFFSNEVEHGKWVQAEISTLIFRAVEEGKQVIPVILDADTPIPPLLRPRCRIGYDQLDQLIDAIYGRSSKPPLGPPPLSASSLRRFVVHLGQPDTAQIAVSAKLDGNPVAAERPVQLGHDFQFSYDSFRHSRLSSARQSAATLCAERARELHQLGDAIGRVLFHGDIEAAFTDLLGQAKAANETVELIVETESPQLLSIPFEAARLSDGRTPALESGVRMLRRPAGVPSYGIRTQPGPLKILVAVGAPDEGKTPNAVLDMERELQSILNAVEKARTLGNAYVRILEVGSLDQIRSSLQEQAYHILHLSGHGNAGVLELEDEDGAPIQARAADIADAIRDSGRAAPLVFLASCLGGAGGSETVSLAQGLLQQGVPWVMAMQTSVTDNYSTHVAAAFYSNLSTSDRPLPSNALALARQQVERERRKNLERGQHDPAEYATVSLFCSGEERPILDRTFDFVRPVEHKRALSGGAVPMLSMGDLIGRRVELRRVMRVLTEHPDSVAEIGRRAGCQILGIGGVGKSAIAGRAMARLADLGWVCAAITGRWTVTEICAKLSAALLSSDNLELKDIARNLAENLPDQVRLQLISNLLSHHDVLLILDNFEDNLSLGGARYLDPATAAVIQDLYKAAQRGKILITCRYPVPDAEAWLATEEPGPLSSAQTRKLVLRLSALRAQVAEGLGLIERVIGGHPRMLQYLDAILRQGKGRLPDIAHRLKEQASKQGINLAEAGGTLTDALQVALQVGAGDILLDQLLDLVAKQDGDLELLCQASVFPRPVSLLGLAFCIGGTSETAQEQFTQLRNAVERIAQSSLLTRTSEDNVWVHRWTAEVIASRIEPEAYRNYCRRGGAYLTSGSRSLVDGFEATRLFLAAQEFDLASGECARVVTFQERHGQMTDLVAIAREMARMLPKDHSDRHRFLGAEADALGVLGFVRESLVKRQQVMATQEKRLEEAPESADRQRDLTVSWDRIGDILTKLGRSEEARGYFQKSLDVAKRLSRLEPRRADRQQDLCISHERMGDVLRDLGYRDQALNHIQTALEIRERLTREEPSRADLQIALCIPYHRMGELLRDSGNGEEARNHFQKALHISELLVRKEPSRADFQRQLSVSNERMGDLLTELGERKQARFHFEEALRISELLARLEPDRADLQRDIWTACNKIGELLRDGEEARAYIERGLEIAQRLVRHEPARADLRRDLAISQEKMGGLMLHSGKRKEARSYFQQALVIREDQARQQPARVDLRVALVVPLTRLGDRQSLERGLGILR